MLRRNRQLGDSQLHRSNSGVVNIDAVDLFDFNNAERKRGCPGTNLLVQAVPRLLVERFGIVDSSDFASGRKHHRCRDDGARQRPHTHLVHTGNMLNACLPEETFEMKHRVEPVLFLLLVVVALCQHLI